MHIYYFILLQGRQIEFGSNVRYVGYSSQDWSGWKICLSSFGHPTGSIVQRMSNFVWVSYQTVFSGIWCFQRRQLYWRYNVHICIWSILLTGSNKQFRNCEFEFYKVGVLQVLLVYLSMLIHQKQSDWSTHKKKENSGFVVSELVVGSGGLTSLIAIAIHSGFLEYWNSKKKCL